jgi:hypothetical protein
MDGHSLFDLNIYLYPLSDNLTAPGLMIFPPNRKAARGRENDLLIVYFSLTGQTAITAEGLQTWMGKKAETFQRSSGTVTAGMRELIEAVNADLYERNIRPNRQNEQVTVNLQVAAIKREMLYLANCGNGQSFFIGTDNHLHLQDSESGGRGLGISQSVAVRFSQSTLAANDFLLLSFKTPENWTSEALAGGQTLSVDAFCRRLFNPAGETGRGVLIRFLEGTGKMQYLRYSQDTTPAPVSEPVKTAAPASVAEKTALPFKQAAVITPIAHPTHKPADMVSGTPPAVEPRQTATPSSPFVTSPRRMATKPAEESATPRGSIIQTDAVKTVVGKALRSGARIKNQANGWVKDTLQKVIPGEPEQPLYFSRGLLIFIAIAVPVIIVAIATTVYIHSGKNNLFGQYLAEAQSLSQRADTQMGDSASRLASLQESIYWLDKADAYGKTADSTALRNQVQAGLDSLEGVIRVDMTSALSEVLPSGTNITQMTATANNDLYALDSATGKVLRFTLTGSTYQQDTKFDCGPNPQSPLNNIGNLVDMVPISPDNSYNATLMAVDASGTLDYCVPADTGYIVKLSAPDMGWGAIQSISLYQNNLYVLDFKGNAVYRYQGSGIDFSDKPTLFFDDVVPPLGDALDIEEIGYELYILRGNGQMIECTYSPLKDMKSTTCQVPAPFVDTRAGQNLSVTSFPEAQFVQMRMTEAPDSSLYLLDASKDTIYHFSYARSLQRVLHPRLTDGTDSTGLTPTAFAVSPGRTLFLAYSNQIYYGQIP